MRKTSTGRIVIFVIGCILLNWGGKRLALALELPLWLDSIGTVITAYTLGPVCGAVVGASVNILSSFDEPIYMVYALVSALVGVIVGLCAKKGWLEHLFGILSTGFLVTLAATAVSTPLDCLFFEGYTGNKWGDGVIDLLQENNCPAVIRYIIGEFYVDFIDKLLLLFILYMLIWLIRRLRRQGAPGCKALRCLVFLAGGFFLLQIPAFAAESGGVDYNNYLQTIYNNENGLSGGIANDIAQTEDGVLWIGTYGGLYRYSGSDFEWMNEFESIKNVNCFYVDAEGRLWIGTNDGGLSLCIDDAIANVLDESDGLPSNSVKCITMGGSYYYVGTTDSLAVVTLSGGLSVETVIPEIVYTWSLDADEQGRVAAVTDDGELFLLEGTEILDETPCQTRDEIFTCCVFGTDGKLYAGTSGSQIFVYSVEDGTLWQENVLQSGDLAYLNDLDFSSSGELVICAYNGIGYLDTDGTFHAISVSSFSSSVGHMIFDYQGNLWFTSSRLGLLKLCQSPFTEIYSKAGLEERLVNTITQWQGNYCFGTDSGLDMVDSTFSESLETELTAQLDGIRIRCLMTDSRGELWICTSGQGVWRVGTDGTPVVYNSENGALGDWFRSALELADGTVAVSGDSGITFFQNGQITGTLGSDDGLENPKVLCMLELDDGTLLAGTDGNGIAVIQDGAVTDILTQEDGLSSKVILRMVADPKGEGVFVVTSNSLCFLNTEGQGSILSNFPYYNNYDIAAGLDGELFVLGSAGIYVVDRDELLSGEDLEYTLLDTRKGLRATLTANAWNYVDEDNNLFLAGDNGVTMVNLGSYSVTYRSYRMDLKSMTVDDQVYSVKLGETVSIPRGTQRVTLSPEIMNYSTSDPHVSLYLEGFDTSAQVTLLSEMEDVTYTNLPAGDYSFHIAILDDKGEVMAENTYQFTKEKEIYDESWFSVYVSFVFVLTIIYLTWMIFRTQIQRTLNIQRRELALARKQVEMSNEAILTIARTVDAKDSNTSQHSFRVSEYSVMIAKRLGFTDEACEELRRTALLHDIGKIGIPDNVLNKPGRLTDEEYALMKSHVTKGAEILKGFTLVDHIVEGAQFHHERYDGTGYTAGLKGEEIPLYARIIGTADAFDAMTSNRVYRKQLDMDYVLSEIRRCRGTQFDPKIADILLELVNDGTIQVEKLHKQSQAREEGGSRT